ncbi:hypothetical protein K501DRAFT_28862 [Backusella circina FSU 941]|nr:hypothetical protein K501DRAFT_28862 [Backusella circina FSU 941]
MEAFLTTLPPYVHDFLNKHPATDVFNLLRELICFAVLYSEDRDGIASKTTELIKKKEDAESDSVVPEISTDIETINEEEEEEEGKVSVEQESISLKVGEKGSSNHNSGQDLHSEQKAINTFPEWWGHRESENITQDTHKVLEKEEVTSPVADNTSLWMPWDVPTVQKPMARTRSQIIPDLRSYLDPSPARSATINTTPKRNSVATTKPDIKGRKTNTGDAKTVRRVSSPVTQPQAAKITTNEKSNVKKQTLNTLKPNSAATTNVVSRSVSSVSMPRQNAALRARAEHARQQQEELERKKQLASKQLGSSTSLHLKQRANSGIDWDKIKADRRKTISETTKK